MSENGSMACENTYAQGNIRHTVPLELNLVAVGRMMVKQRLHPRCVSFIHGEACSGFNDVQNLTVNPSNTANNLPDYR